MVQPLSQSNQPTTFKESLIELMQAKQNVSTACYAKKCNIFPLTYLDELKSAIMSSPYLADSQLSDRFNKTRGFSVVFKRSSILEVVRLFPYFQLYLETALKSACNAFYLNFLIIESGGCVETHVDCSLSDYGKVWTIPNLVSVLYIQVPEDLQGGELILEKGDRRVAQITPQVNTLLYFIGNLFHSVNSVQSSQPRISLICEQYTLAPERLQLIPEFEILSGATMKSS
ncbi:2OG-Fe(II) oxygenase [Halotia branconii]|uniref:2OG-Fe(II) oxygenase n=1 Tax=Halotia branconii CENA392 TaxID=1539056 RepID=A0AAJ6NVA2_9CYAN|nr:2OG-Fe(II) oxygenase [Halotia branconii]WGV27158.1 2OG-Fe(II) oxygenase [Halotia branconii CENA392]